MKRTISAVLCAALALTLAGCAEEKEPMLDQTVTVETTAAQPGELSTESTYIGTISAEGTASVVSLVSGNVEEVMVSVGDTVSAGDPLCRIDDESARLALQNAQAAYQSAQESYNSAQAGYGGADLPVLEELLRLCDNVGVGVVPYQLLLGGMQTGKYRRGQEAPAGSRLADMPEWMKPFTDET